RQEIPKGEWHLVSSVVSDSNRSGQLPLIELEVEGGLKPGWIYEVVYEAEGPLVQGTGLAGIRDIVSALKFGSGEQNPLLTDAGKPLCQLGLAFCPVPRGRY